MMTWEVTGIWCKGFTDTGFKSICSVHPNGAHIHKGTLRSPLSKKLVFFINTENEFFDGHRVGFVWKLKAHTPSAFVLHSSNIIM